MKIILPLMTAIMIFSATPVLSSEIPSIMVDGVEHFLINKDHSSNERFRSASGYCRLHGYSYSPVSMAQQGLPGPYAALNDKGEVIRTYPKDESRAYDYSTLVKVQCTN